jgi:PAS domain S-box-containing protein
MTFLELIGKALRRDLVMDLVMVIYSLLTLFYFLPLVEPDLLENLAWYFWDPVLLTLALFAVRKSLPRTTHGNGRRFWHLVSLALSFWLAASLLTSVLHLLYSSQWIDLLVDILHLGYYLSLVLATDLKPDVFQHVRRLDTDQRINLIAAVGLCFTFLVYFVLIPNHLDLGEATSMRSAVLLYLGLDLVLLARFTALALASQDDRWRLTYRILATGMLLSAFLVCLELVSLFPGSLVPFVTGTPWDLLWLLPFLPFILAARLPMQMAEAIGSAEREMQVENPEKEAAWGPTLLYALLLPCAHLILHHIGWIDAPSQQIREGLAISCFIIFGALALVQYNRRELARQRAQKSLRASEHRYRQLVESSPDAILVERQGRIVYLNPAAQELLGTKRLAQGHDLAELGLPEPLSQRSEEVLEHTSPIALPFEHRILNHSGQPLDVEVSYLWIRYQGGLACQAILRDVTTLRALRVEAEGMERMAALGEFAATIAHEIRNPLASLVFNTRYLFDRLPMTKADQEELIELEHAIDMMQNTVTRVLELSRTEQSADAAQTSPVDKKIYAEAKRE